MEREVKLVYSDAEAARRSIESIGGRLVVSRRLLDDRLFDTPEQSLRQAGSALRVRRDGQKAILTFKGAAERGPVKSRPEIETTVGDADKAEAIVGGLGFRRWFRAQKFRAEYACGQATVCVDETPIGVFVEIEAPTIAEIDRIAGLLGKSRVDYRLESYPALYMSWCAARNIAPGDMVF